jgi:hypothetical protein
MNPRSSSQARPLEEPESPTTKELAHIEHWFEGLSSEEKAVFDGLANLDRAEEDKQA